MSYLVLTHIAYADEATNYIPCLTRADVEAQLTDYGYLENPGIYVFKVPTGTSPQEWADELAADVDPYPDYYVRFGPRGGIRWETY